MAALSWHSLKLRLPLLIVVLFLGGLWALAGFANYQLRHDMRHQIERQQRSVAALAAQALEHTLQERQAILLRVARHFAPVLEHAPEQLNRPATDFRALRQPFGEVLSTPDSTQLGLVVLQQLFNGGTFVTNAQGLALTSFPPHILRTGNDYGGESFIQAALAGRSVVSAPFIETGTPVVVLAVPIWGSSGQPIGVLAGVLDLSRPNLLSHIEQQTYGEQGTFFIADVATQTVLAANQPQRVMERLPPLGSNPLVDALAQGQFAQLEYDNQGQAWLVALQPIAALLHALEQPLAFAHTAQHCSVSIGIVVFGGATHEPPMELLRKVDLALNQAKNTGPGSILFYEAQMQAQVTTRARLQHDLREALQQESFCLHYQPQINAAGQVVGVEALVRWISKEHGFISPAEFIPLAEKTGLILPLGRWILHTACTQLAQWARQPQRQGLSMAVNVSAGQFQQSNFVEQVREVLQETGAPAHQLKLELTESAMVEDMEAVVARMQALRQLGVRFSIDDFGTGFSSLAYLKRLPLDQLKIDQGFVRDCLEDHNDASIAQTVIALGHSLGLEVIAEGVETAAHQAALQSWGCRFFQGYGISKPLPAQALEAFLTTHAAVAASASATTAPLPPG